MSPSPRTVVGPMIQLRGAAPFASLSGAQLATLALGVEPVVLQRGSPVLERHQPAEALFVVQDGEAIVEDGRGGSTRVGRGGVLGFLELLAQEPVSRKITAGTELAALRLDAETLRDACDVHFGILTGLLAHVSGIAAGSPPALRDAIGVVVDPGPMSTGPDGPMDRVARILALHRSPVFPSAGMDAVAELVEHLEEREVPDGTSLWDPDRPTDGAFLIVAGQVELHVEGWTSPLELGRGAVPGLVTTLASAPAVVRAWARSPVRALYVSCDTLLDILEDHPDMAFAFLGRLASCVLRHEGAGDS